MDITYKKKVVLVVEDDLDIRNTIADVLAMEGFAVVEAVNGQEALGRLREGEAPNLILLDLMMPVKDGLAFCMEQRQDPKLAEIPVVVMSADSRLNQKMHLNHCARILKKPVDLEDLLSAIHHYAS